MPDSFGRHLRRITRQLATRLTSILRKFSGMFIPGFNELPEMLRQCRMRFLSALKTLADTTA
jgi:hypothetical protein